MGNIPNWRRKNKLEKFELRVFSLRHQCSPVNLLHIFRRPLYKYTYEGLLKQSEVLWDIWYIELYSITLSINKISISTRVHPMAKSGQLHFPAWNIYSFNQFKFQTWKFTLTLAVVDKMLSKTIYGETSFSKLILITLQSLHIRQVIK